MRSLILLLASVSILPAAKAGCNAEAQFIATVSVVQAVDAKTCNVKVEAPRFYAANQLCPLSLPTLLKKGLSIPRLANGACSVGAGVEISGVAVLADGATEIILD